MEQPDERLRDLTRRMKSMNQAKAFVQFAWLIGKYCGKSLSEAALESGRFDLTNGGDVQRVIKSAVAGGSTTDATWASELSPYRGVTGEWISEFSLTTFLGQLPFLRVPFFTSAIIETTPTSAAWVGPGVAIPVSSASLTATLALPMKKLGAISVFTNELFSNWGPAQAAHMSDALGKSARKLLDQSLLNPDLGVTADRPASLTNGIAASQSTGDSAAQMTADLKAALGTVLNTTADPKRVRILMGPSTALHGASLFAANGGRAFPNLTAVGGDVWGVPVLVSPGATGLGSPDSNIIGVVDGGRVLVADDGLITADASSVASLEMSTVPTGDAADGTAMSQNTVSLFQGNATALRLIFYKNFVRANAGAIAWFPVAY